MKIISFSLWGNKPMYTVGALENIELAKEIYPEWVCRFYVDKSVDDKVKDSIIKNGGQIQEIHHSVNGAFYGMFWRFLANDDENMEVMISRDCDSRLSHREKVAVDEWVNSNYSFHTMHDHYAHRSVPVLGGMWGVKRGWIIDMGSKIINWGKYDRKGIDQEFLKCKIWENVRERTMSHSSINNIWNPYRPFPQYSPSRYDVKYVGEIFDENNNRVES